MKARRPSARVRWGIDAPSRLAASGDLVHVVEPHQDGDYLRGVSLESLRQSSRLEDKPGFIQVLGRDHDDSECAGVKPFLNHVQSSRTGVDVDIGKPRFYVVKHCWQPVAQCVSDPLRQVARPADEDVGVALNRHYESVTSLGTYGRGSSSAVGSRLKSTS